MPLAKVVEIINSDSIRVKPGWIFTNPDTREKVYGDIIIIGKFQKIYPKDEVWIKRRLEILILNKIVFLTKMHEVETAENSISVVADIILQRTEISYYFPEFKFEDAMELI